MQVERTQQTSARAAGSLHARGSVRAPDRPWIRPWIKCLAEQVRWLAVVVMLGCAVLAPRAALAQSDAFSVEVAVSDRSPTERQDAYSQALRRVLVSNSGDKTIMNRDEIRRALSVAEDYVETYRFRTPEPGTRIPADTLVSDSVRETGEATDLLLVRFDRESVLALVAGGGNDQTSEGAEISVNPLDNIDRALVWLLIEDAERTVREAEPAASKVRERLREIAGGGGVELVFPDAGLGAGRGSDLGAGSNTGSDATTNAATINELLSDEALRSQNIQAVRSASLRYATDVVLTGYLSRAVPPALDVNDARDAQALATPDSRVRSDSSPGRAPRTEGRAAAAGWIGEWTRSAGDLSEATRTSGDSLDDVLRAGISWLISDVSLGLPASYEYGGAGSSAEGLVRIDGLGSIEDYAQLSSLLASVPGVSNSWPRELSGDSAVFSIVPRNALGAVSAALDGVSWLRRGVLSSDSAQGTVARSTELVYDVVR